MTDKRRPIKLLPAVHQTEPLKRFFGSTIDHLFQPGEAQPISGYIGRVPAYTNPVTDFYVPEPTADRVTYQLEAMMVSTVGGDAATALFYPDLLLRLSAMGSITTIPDRLFQSSYWSWAPPVDIDKINNFQQYYWSGDDVPALDLTLPGLEISQVYKATSEQREFVLPPVLPCMRVLPEREVMIGGVAQSYDPSVLINGVLTSAFTVSGDNILLNAGANAGDTVEIYRYGNVSDGTRTDFSYPTIFDSSFPWTNSDICVYLNGRATTEFTVVDANRIRLNTAPPENTPVTVTIFNSIKALCVGKTSFDISNMNSNGVPALINGLKINLIDPSVFYMGFDVKPYDTFKWDESSDTVYFVDGVGTSIYLTDASTYPGLDAQYVVISRQDPVRSYWSTINRWVTSASLAWFGGDLYAYQARRPICEYLPELQQFNYGQTRAPDVDAMFGVVSDWTQVPFTRQLTDDTGRVVDAGDIVLFGNVGNTALNNQFFVWPTIDDDTDPSTIVLTPFYAAVEGDVVSYLDSGFEYRFTSDIWIECATVGDFPLFDLYDNNGDSIGDTAIYPLTTFTGSRIFCYQIGTGANDTLLGFPPVYDNYGQLLFQNDLYTITYSWAEGTFDGFLYYRVGTGFHNQWYKAAATLPAVGSQASIVVPLNLQANPNFGTPQYISKNNWFTQFSSIVENQAGIAGAPYSANNWTDTARDLSLGTQIIQSRAPLLKLMLIVGENGFDMQNALAYAENEYVRLKLKIRQKIKLGLNSGTYITGLDTDATVKSILQSLNANKSSSFAFFLSPIGGGSYFIPPTSATLNVTQMVEPKMIVENGDTFLLGHDGSKSASVDSVTDSIMLAFENLIFQSRQSEAYHPEVRPQVDEIDLVGGKYRVGAYSLQEANSIVQPRFEDWARTNGVNYQENTTFDPDNPFTWNYSSLVDRDGDAIPGHWRAIYRYYFDTETPNLTPWEMLGFPEQPSWWAGLYGSAPYNRSNAVWADIEAGRIASGPRAGIDTRFARPNLNIVLPVDPSGNLLDPVDARIVLSPPTIQLARQNWAFGDGGPVETLWRRSSSFGFTRVQGIFLMRPAQFIEYYWDTDNQIIVNIDQWIDTTTNDRPSNAELYVHGEVLVDGSTKVSLGIQNWLVEYMIFRGQAPTTLGNMVRGLNSSLAHKMAGYTTPDRLSVNAESFGLVPIEDINVALYRSPGIYVDNYSGVLIEFLRPGHWRIVGYNPTSPSFNIQPSDPNGVSVILAGAPERVVNPWTHGVYYKVGMYVIYEGLLYSCVTNHISTSTFESAYWTGAGATMATETLYRQMDADGSTSTVAYGTVMQSRQEVINFLVAYQRSLLATGFVFPEGSWDEVINSFINWSSVDWVSGSFLTLSPGARSIEYSTPQGYILDLTDPFSPAGVLNRAGLAIDKRNIQIDRYDGELTLSATGLDDIFGLTIRKSEIEHILIFSNLTVFNDIIYDPVLNVRQTRLHLNARRTTNWTGRYDAPGFMLVNGQIVNNFDKSAEDFRYAFDIELADNTILRDHARHLVGFQSRQYMTNLLVNNVEQFEFFQGMIQEKGSPQSMSKILRSTAVESNGDIAFLEEWAFKLSEFGANEPRGYAELALTQSDMMRQNQLVHLDVPLVSAWLTTNYYNIGDFVTVSGLVYEARTVHVSTDFDTDLNSGYWIVDSTDVESSSTAIVNIPTTDSRWVSTPLDFTAIQVADHSGFRGLADAGYVRVNEPTYSYPTYDDFTTATQTFIQNGGTYTAGESVWVYSNGLSGWTVDILNYPTLEFTCANLVSTNLSDTTWATSTSLHAISTSLFTVAPSSIAPNVIPDAAWLAYIDGIGVASQPTAALYSTITSPVLAGALYSVSMDGFVTLDFNGAISIQVDWFSGSSLLSTSTLAMTDFRTSGPTSYQLILSDSAVAPTGATTASLWISVTYGTSLSSGRAYLADPSFVYDDVGVLVTVVDTADTNSAVVGTRYTLSQPHNFAVGDIAIIAGPIDGNYAGSGALQVSNVDTDDFMWFEVDLDEDVTPYDFTTSGTAGPQVFNAQPARFATKAAAISGAIGGTLNYVDDSGNGTWAVYQAPDFTNAVRTQPSQVTDMTKVVSALVYASKTLSDDQSLEPEPVTLATINPVDPLCGLMVGVADREVDYKIEYDPAIYDQSEGIWGDAQIGRVWWDMSVVWYLNPYTNSLENASPASYLEEIQYRANNWAKLAPGSSVNLYEWTRSSLSPSDYTTGTVYTSGNFVEVTEYDPDVGYDVSFYYFWVLNPTTVPDVSFRKLDLGSCSSILSNPALAGIPWMAVISEKDLLLTGLLDYLTDDTIVQTLVQLTTDEDLPHVEWKLVRPTDATSQPPPYLWTKMRDSLVRFDDNLAAVPNPALHSTAQTGIGQGQAMFDTSKTVLARQSYITMVNYQLARTNYSLDPNFGSDMLTFTTPIPTALSWVLLDGQTTLATLPPVIFYDAVTNDPAELTTLLQSNPDGYRVLLDNRFGTSPSWTVWVQHSGQYSIASAYSHTVASRSALTALTANIGDMILIQEDSQFDNFWTIVQKTADTQYNVVWAQTYDTSSFWSYTDWYATGYSSDNQPIVVYANSIQRNLAEGPVPTNNFVKLSDNGSGQWIWTSYTGGAWITVAQELGTVQLSDKFYTNTLVYGWNNGDYFYNGADVLNRDGSFELRVFFDEMLSSILTTAEQNELWFSMVNFVHATHDQVDWAFKTSFMTIAGYNAPMVATPTTTPDYTPDIQSYIEEVKPYHVTIRDFTQNFALTEQPNITITDFDKPSYYDPVLKAYRSLDPNNAADVAIMQTGPWQYWLNNKNLTRLFSVDFVLDRIWFTNTTDSGAAARIMSYYNPDSNMTPKDLSILLNLDFQGTIIDDLTFGNAPTESVPSNVNGYFPDGTEGYQMRDPRVATDTPEELVRLGSHDVFLCSVNDKWGEGAPMSTVRHFDVSRETSTTVNLNMGALVRSIVVFGDGRRLFEGREFTYDQLSATATVILGSGESRIQTVALHGFGYAAHTPVLGQLTLSATGGEQTVGFPDSVIADGVTVAVEVTSDRNLITSDVVDNNVTFSAGVGQDIVLTFYDAAADTTSLIDVKFSMQESPSGPTDTNPFSGTFTLPELPLMRPLLSSVIVEKNGLRLFPGIMSHIYNLTVYPIGDTTITDPTQILIIDDTGVATAPEVHQDGDFANITDALAYVTSARYLYWNQYLILLDSDAATRAYVLTVQNTGDYAIDDTTGILTINSMLRSDEIRVLFWRNDLVMQPHTWAFTSHTSGMYRIMSTGRVGSSWLTLGGKRLVENVDYTVAQTTAGAWDVNPFDTFNYSDLTPYEFAIKQPNGNTGNIVITTFDGPQATPALVWQSTTTTPDIYRFNTNPNYVSGKNGPLVIENQSWEITTSNSALEGGALVSDIPAAQLISSFSVEMNPSDSPEYSHHPFMIPDADNNAPGVVWLDAERIEYYTIAQQANIVTFGQIRRGTRCTPMLPHAEGEVASVQHNMRGIPSVPVHGLTVPSTESEADAPIDMAAVPDFEGWYLKVNVTIPAGVSETFDIARLNFPVLADGGATYCDVTAAGTSEATVVQRDGTPYDFTFTFYTEPNLAGLFTLDLTYPAANWDGPVDVLITYQLYNQTLPPFSVVSSTVTSNTALTYPFGVSGNE